MAGQSCFDFAKLNPKAAQLHLLISAANKFDLTVGVEPGPVAGAIQPRAGRFTEGMHDEFRRRLGGGIQIAAAYAGAADVQLARDAERTRPLGFVENKNLAVGDRPTNRHSACAADVRGNAIERHDAGGFGLAEHVYVPRRVSKLSRPGSWNSRQQRLTGGKH